MRWSGTARPETEISGDFAATLFGCFSGHQCQCGPNPANLTLFVAHYRAQTSSQQPPSLVPPDAVRYFKSMSAARPHLATVSHCFPIFG